MLDILHSFAIGIAFACGVIVGASLCQMVRRKGRDEIRDWQAHYTVVEERLAKYVAHTERIAVACEAMADVKKPGIKL